MPDFEPSFKDFQKDIERYLISIGKREKRKDGMIVFTGYPEALNKIFDLYLTKGALSPLAKHFRTWNWEYKYDNFLERLTDSLKAKADWSNLQLLWEKGVLRCRKKLYNDLWKFDKDSPGTLKPKSLEEAKTRLLQTINDICSLATAFGASEEKEKYLKMKDKVENGRRA